MSFSEPRYDEEPPEDEALLAMNREVPWHAHVLPIALTAAMVASWLLYIVMAGRFETEGLGMLSWAISAAALAEGRYETILLHMFAHGGPMHILMNSAALIALGPPLIARLGPPALGWLRFCAVFVLSGLAGAALYLAVHPAGEVPMLGASGAICGLLGLLARFQPESDQLLPIRSREIWLTMKDFAKDNVILFVMLTVPALLAGQGGGVAWEAHLGGLLFGLFAGPLFAPRPAGANGRPSRAIEDAT
jgi:membrane associated rhomboid family serine protease